MSFYFAMEEGPKKEIVVYTNRPGMLMLTREQLDLVRQEGQKFEKDFFLKRGYTVKEQKFRQIAADDIPPEIMPRVEREMGGRILTREEIRAKAFKFHKSLKNDPNFKRHKNYMPNGLKKKERVQFWIDLGYTVEEGMEGIYRIWSVKKK